MTKFFFDNPVLKIKFSIHHFDVPIFGLLEIEIVVQTQKVKCENGGAQLATFKICFSRPQEHNNYT